MATCTHCGYDLQGSTGAICPECGASTDPAALITARDVMRIGLQLMGVWTVGRGLMMAVSSFLAWRDFPAFRLNWISFVFAGGMLLLLARPIAKWTTTAIALGRFQALEVGLRLLGCYWLSETAHGLAMVAVRQGWDSSRYDGALSDWRFLTAIVMPTLGGGIALLAAAPLARRLSRGP